MFSFIDKFVHPAVAGRIGEFPSKQKGSQVRADALIKGKFRAMQE
jgi:hypothetical protein